MKSITCLVTALLLSACASSYPRLVSVQAIAPAENSEVPDLDQALAAAETLQTEYSNGYVESARARDLGQLPIIAAAAAAAWIVLDDGTNAARDVGRIGIGAGAYSAVRGQLVAADMPNVYIAGHGALTCVLAQGSYFAGAAGQTRYRAVGTNLELLSQVMASTVSDLAAQPTDGTADELALLRTTKSAAEQALAQARAVAATARSETMAYQSSGSVFWVAVSAISTRVASRGRNRPDVNYRSLVEEFSPPAEEVAGGAESQSVTHRPARQITEALIRDIGELTDAAARLRGVTPNYTERLARVADCPTQVGS